MAPGPDPSPGGASRPALWQSAWRFGAVGVLNTLAGLSVILLARGPFGLPELAANAVGYAAALMLSFALNRRWSFGHRGAAGRAAWRFALVVALAWLANAALAMGLIALGVAPPLAHTAGIVPYTLLTFIGCRWWAFAPAASAPPPPTGRRA